MFAQQTGVRREYLSIDARKQPLLSEHTEPEKVRSLRVAIHIATRCCSVRRTIDPAKKFSNGLPTA